MSQTRYSRAMEMVDQGFSNETIAKAVGVHAVTVSGWRAKRRQLEAAEEENELTRLKAELEAVTKERDWLRSVVASKGEQE